MKVYKFKCKDCGSTKYNKVSENVYKCVYCGCVEEIFNPEEIKQQNIEKTEQMIDQRVQEAIKEAKAVERKEKAEHLVKTSLVRLLLCIFLGNIGAHRFYERKYVSGILYLLSFGLLGIGWGLDTLINILKLVKSCSKSRRIHEYDDGEFYE